MFLLLSSDVDECVLRKQDPKYEDMYPCRKGICHNTPGGYLCKCKLGKRSDGTNYGCRPLRTRAEQVAIGKVTSTNFTSVSPTLRCSFTQSNTTTMARKILILNIT